MSGLDAAAMSEPGRRTAKLRTVAGWLMIVIALWIGEGVITGMQFHTMAESSGAPISWSAALRPSLASALLWVPFTLMALSLARRWPVGKRASNLIAHLVGLAITIVGRALAVMVLNPVIGWYTELPRWTEVMSTSVQNNLFLYVLVTGAAHGVHYARQHRLREAQLARAELAALRSQIEPHFLFNALNAISASVRSAPETAEQMIARLSTLLRRSLEYDGAAVVPLLDEIRVAASYLDIEQVRFADRLSVVWDIDEAVLDAAVPAFFLQPLVENAVRHGLLPRPEPGTVRIAAWRDGDQLHVTVEDDGIGMPAAASTPSGVGLANTRARLAQLYGSRHVLDIAPRSAGGTLVRVVLPYAPAESRERSVGV